MSKPVAFIDTSWLASLSKLGDTGASILREIDTNYELHITREISNELANGRFSPQVSDWLANSNNIILDQNPVTDSLKSDRALTKNAGDLSIYEAARNYPGATVLMDDGFASDVMGGKPISDYIQNKQASSYQDIKNNFGDIFDSRAVASRESSINVLQKSQGALGISDDALFGAIKQLAPSVAGFKDELVALAKRLGVDESGSVGLPNITGAQAIRAFGMALGALGLGLAAYDMITVSITVNSS